MRARRISPSPDWLEDMLPLAIELGLQIVKYGEEAHVDLAGFTLDGPDAKPLRYAERRAAAKAEREAEREVRRADRQRAKASGHAQSTSTSDAARAEVKAAVAEAVANKPKGRIWCVPFARAVTGLDIRGNAKTWWQQAKGRYARGQEPEVGAVMPARILSSVLLPAPFSPTRASTSPARSSNSSPRSAQFSAPG